MFKNIPLALFYKDFDYGDIEELEEEATSNYYNECI